MELKKALELEAGVALEALIGIPSTIISKGHMYFLVEKAKPQYKGQIIPSSQEELAINEPCGAIFTVKDTKKRQMNVSYAFFRLSGTV